MANNSDDPVMRRADNPRAANQATRANADPRPRLAPVRACIPNPSDCSPRRDRPFLRHG